VDTLEVKGVYKKIGKKEIIKGINFYVKPGEILGFLGPNGAGKTTTIRMIVGLIKPTMGSIKIMGYDIQKSRVAALKNVGCIVENPVMYDDLSGLRNLKLCADMYGDVTNERITEIIDIIGLKDRINDKVKKYSLGMKQRLGLGQAILSNPKLLILDEPTNGLDPVGIHDFKEIIRHIAKKNNSAVVISTHILSEIEQLCDRFVFIKDGIIQTTEAISPEDNEAEILRINTKESDKLIKLLQTLSFIIDIKSDNDQIMIKIKKDFYSNLINEIGKNNIQIEQITKVEYTLEDRFMKMMEGGI